MMRMQAGITIDRPVAEVFEFIVRFENVPRYVDAVVESYQTSEGPVGIGTTGVEVLGGLFEGTRLEWRISKFDQNKLCAFVNTLPLPLGSSVDREVTYTFESVETGARVSCREVGQVLGPLRVVGPLLAVLARLGRGRMLARIKEILESAEGPPANRKPAELS